jgi:ATP-binding cassette subfamily B protein AbcA/BmrA
MNKNKLQFLLKKIRLPKLQFTISVFIAALGAVSGLLIPLVAGKFIDSFSLENFNTTMIIFLAVLFIVSGVLTGLGNFFMGVVGERINYSIRKVFFDKIIKLKVSFFDDNDTGNLISRMIDDTTIINEFLSNRVPTIFPSLLTFIGSLFFLFIIDWKMTIIALITMCIFILLIIPIGRFVHNISLKTQNETANFSTLLNKIFTEIRLVKISNTENEESKNANTNLLKLYNLGIKEVIAESIINPISSIITLLTFGIILGVGGVRVSLGIITSGELISMVFYVFQLSSPINEILTFFTDYKKTIGASSRIYDIFHEEEEVYNSIDNKELPDNGLVLKNITFSYQKRTILNNISLEIPKNKVTAIVGPSGSGKTTILNIIERLYPITSGEIYYGEQSIYDIPLNVWRKNIGYVMQDNPMMNRSIKYNLLYGISNDISEKEMIKYTKMTDSYNFINSTEQGFDTVIGERGTRLSGGQRQRLDLTRNLIKNPKILLFDEATSNLDSESERKIQNSIDNLSGTKTVVIVAHRLSTIKRADQIIFIENSRITGKGTHEELLSRHPKYKLFVETQSLYN